ncbi:hypothetical protein GE061_014548 [Apolygus lucorum]|uniref:EGF-like domain-containing protein n=1 Tax=Apolygus lucorum TaxID=248454 RepID=A0A8S9XIK4_APOLU|nr:hypothetical protein GE061_014548 [Apolygus lucorum]
MCRVSHMELIRNFIKLVLLSIPSVVSLRPQSDCRCSFGGLCIEDPYGFIARTPCESICPKISGGFYDTDCSTIVNHCSSSPCSKGSCVPTFGSYFCKCPEGLYGRDCEINEESLRNSGLKQELHVYYQVQPWRSSGSNLFTLVFDPSGNDYEKNNWIIQLVVNTSDGRSYHPRVPHFQRSEIKSNCLKDAVKNPRLRDPRVCDYLPSGDVSIFSFNPSYVFSRNEKEKEEDVSISGMGTVGRVISVSVYVYLIHLKNRANIKEVFSQTYRTFTYLTYRAPHNCVKTMDFTHCSTDHRVPYVHSRGTDIEIDCVSLDLKCPGNLFLGFQWKIQRHTDSLYPIKGKDLMPVPISHGAELSTNSLLLRKHSLNSGIHMIEYTLMLRGAPPHFGGTKEFNMTGQCWIKVYTSEPIIEVKGGRVQTVSCFKAINIELMNLSPDVDIKEMKFETSCNDTDDHECGLRIINTPLIWKDGWKCNYYLDMEVIPKVPSLDLTLDPLHIHIHFIESVFSIQIECIYNCFPINPKMRILLAATTDRYLPFTVNWTVETEDHRIITARDGDVDAFLPSSATRILRINGDRFLDAEKIISKVHFRAQGPVVSGNPDVRAVVSTLNIRVEVELVETNYEERLTFSPFWKLVQLCVYNTYGHFACNKAQEIEGEVSEPPDLTIADLELGQQSGDHYNFCRNVLIYLTNHVKEVSLGSAAVKWNIPVGDRLAAAKLINKMEFKGFVDLDITSKSVLLLLFCTVANEMEDLIAWKDEDFASLPYGVDDLYNFKDFTIVIMTLAYITKNRNPLLPTESDSSIHGRIQEGIWKFWLWKNDYIFNVALDKFTHLFALSTTLFYSIGANGGKFTRLWHVRSTYVGILEAFKKKTDHGAFKENLEGAADYIFAPEFGTIFNLDWLNLFEVALPPVQVEWEYKELTLLVMVAKNKEGDYSLSPYLFLQMRRAEQLTLIHELPGSTSINVTLPRMVEGVLRTRANHKFFRDSLPKSDAKERSILAYKVTLPVEYDAWNITIRRLTSIPLKAKVFDKVPDVETMMATPDLVPTFDWTKRNFRAYVEVLPAKGEKFIPHYFYLGIALPSSKVHGPAEGTEFSLQRSTDVCASKVSADPSDAVQICRGIQGNEADESVIICNCRLIGFYQAIRLPIKISKLLLDLIPYRVPLIFTYYNAVVVGIFSFCIFAVAIFAYHRDNLYSRSQDSLIYLHDNYPADVYCVVVGVFTGLYLQGGTNSKVALKLIGDRFSSRVHVLSSTVKETLGSGHDDWFVVSLNKPLGKLKFIQFWLDHHDLYGWYCERFIVYDIYEHSQYMAKIEKWLIIEVLEDVPRVETAAATHMEMKGDGSFEQMPHSFFKNYLTELRNTHSELSLFLVQERYLFSYHVKCCIVIIKFLSMYLWIWFFQEIAYKWTHGKYLDPVSTGHLIGLSKELFIWAFWAALLSHPFAFLVDYLYRCSTISSVIQKRTTNPIYGDTGVRVVPRLSRKLSMYYSQMSDPQKNLKALQELSAFTPTGEWKHYLRLLVGPCQFRCVDVDKEAISIKTHRMALIVRWLSYGIITTQCFGILFVEFYTDFQTKSLTCAVVVAIALLLDAFFLSPVLILMKSFIAFYILGLKNKEKYLMSEEMRVSVQEREHYLDYFVKVLGREYKPLLSTEIEFLKKRKLVMWLTLKTLFSLFAVFAMFICFRLMTIKLRAEDYYMVRTLRDSVEATGHPDFGIFGRTIYQVYDVPSAADYVTNNVADFTGVWQNGKVIKGSARAPHVRWSYDNFGQGISSTSVLLLLQSHNAEQVIPVEFDEYFENSIGSFSISYAKTEPIIRGKKMKYTIISDSWIYGKSLISYPFAGHFQKISLNPWEDYYSKMRMFMDDFVSLERGDCRAMIISNNYVYPFVQYIVTVDVIIEFHASGLAGVQTQVQGLKMDQFSLAFYERGIIVGIFVLTVIFTSAKICRIGLKRYFAHLPNIIQILTVLSLGAFVICHALRVQLKLKVIQNMIHSPVNEYVDLHSIYDYELIDSLCLLAVFSMFLIDLALLVPTFLTPEWLNHICKSTIRVALLFYLLQQYGILMTREFAQMIDYAFARLIVLIQTRQIPSYFRNYSRLNYASAFYSSIIILAIMNKALTAVIICMTLHTKASSDTPYSRYKAVLKTEPTTLQKPYMKTSHEDRQSYVRESLSRLSINVSRKHKLYSRTHE